MIIKKFTIRDFGAVTFFDTALTPKLNIVDSRYSAEISAAMGIFLCSKAQEPVPSGWIRPTTRLAARVLCQNSLYLVTAVPRNGRLSLTITDSNGTDVTDAYKYMLSQTPEQDATESFDGQDRTLPHRLCWYRNYADAPEDVEGRTASLVDTKTFRSHLRQYIRAFQSQPINCKKDYQTAIDYQGEFRVFHPRVSGNISLSTTEEKLFLYICFLNIAEFWEEIAEIRNFHYEKKPLVIQNFLEFLDDSTNMDALFARTAKQQRQVIILTLPHNT